MQTEAVRVSAVSTQREADEAQIKRQLAGIAEGIRAKDLESLRSIYTADVVSFDVEPPLQHVGIEAKLKNWAKVFAIFQDVDYEVRDLDLIVGDDVGFGHGFGRLHGTLMNERRPMACGCGSRSASGSWAARGRSCTTRLRSRSTCLADGAWPTLNPDEACPCGSRPVTERAGARPMVIPSSVMYPRADGATRTRTSKEYAGAAASISSPKQAKSTP